MSGNNPDAAITDLFINSPQPRVNIIGGRMGHKNLTGETIRTNGTLYIIGVEFRGNGDDRVDSIKALADSFT
jgi:hypothetical protein